MILQIEIKDEYIPSINQYIQTQAVYKPDPLTGQPIVTVPFDSPEDFILDHIAQVVQGTLKLFPTQAMRTQMIEVKRLEEEMKSAARPKIVKDLKNGKL